jgi:hypothetical protein
MRAGSYHEGRDGPRWLWHAMRMRPSRSRAAVLLSYKSTQAVILRDGQPVEYATATDRTQWGCHKGRGPTVLK